jgi:hypothetical protein
MSARTPKIEGPPPETKNNRSVVSAAAVQYGFDAGHCAHSDTTPQHGAEANSQTLTIGKYGRLDEASRRIVEKAMVEHLSPLALCLAARAKDVRALDRAALAFRLEIYEGVLAAMRLIRHNEPAQRPFKPGHLDHSKVKIKRNGLLAPETKMVVDDAIFAALAPLATSREVQSAIYFHCDEVITADLIQAIRDTVWTERFAALKAGGRANG